VLFGRKRRNTRFVHSFGTPAGFLGTAIPAVSASLSGVNEARGAMESTSHIHGIVYGVAGEPDLHTHPATLIPLSCDPALSIRQLSDRITEMHIYAHSRRKTGSVGMGSAVPRLYSVRAAQAQAWAPYRALLIRWHCQAWCSFESLGSV